jgi:hypothetical protein
VTEYGMGESIFGSKNAIECSFMRVKCVELC